MPRYGAVEMGGTKTTVGVGGTPEDLEYRTIATTDPEETLGRVIEILRAADPEAVGIASFGPLDLPTGRIGVTPKRGWSGTELVEPVQHALEVPVGLDTDVNGAALGEGRWGAGRGMRSIVYVTVGTGIGGGALIDGAPVHGLGHPEMGHITVRRHSEDRIPGVCRLHADCLEGLASGPAIAARWGRPAEHLGGAELQGALGIESFYLAQMVRDLVYVLAPERVIIGGGVARLPGLLDQVNECLIDELSGYPGLPAHSAGFVVPPGLGELSGLAGGLILAEGATAMSFG
jgi:fructokinase